MTFAKKILIDDSGSNSVEVIFKNWLVKRESDIFTLTEFSAYLDTLDLEEYYDTRKLSYLVRSDAQALHRVRIDSKIERVYCKLSKTAFWKDKSGPTVIREINKYKDKL